MNRAVSVPPLLLSGGLSVPPFSVYARSAVPDCLLWAICTNAKEQDTFPILPPHDLRDHLAEHAGTQRGIFLLTGIEIINVLLSDLFFIMSSRLHRFVIAIIGKRDNFYSRYDPAKKSMFPRILLVSFLIASLMLAALLLKDITPDPAV